MSEYSAVVEMWLEVAGKTYSICSIGPARMRLKQEIHLPPGASGFATISIEGRPRRFHAVFPDGANGNHVNYIEPLRDKTIDESELVSEMAKVLGEYVRLFMQTNGLLENYDRLRGTNLCRKGSPLELAVDSSNGRYEKEMRGFLEFVVDVLQRLPVKEKT